MRAELLAEVWRGQMVESRHYGHAVVMSASGQIEAAWGDPEILIYPRSSCKMIQALPLLESGVGAGLSPQQIALATASHIGASMHTDLAASWLESLGLSEADLRCGAQWPEEKAARHGLHETGHKPSQIHNNCSGKHAGFLMLGQHLGGGAEYIEPDHPVQKAVRAAFEDMVGEESPGFGLDGCSAPNFACSLRGLGWAMARFSTPGSLSGARSAAAERIASAMRTHPALVCGEGRAGTELTLASGGKAIAKSGAEGVFTAILPEAGLGVAVKIEDGARRAAEAAIAALLVRLGVVDPANPRVQPFLSAPVPNFRRFVTGHVKPAAGLLKA